MVCKLRSCSFGFCPNYLDPPSPKFGQLIPLFRNSNVPKIFGRGVPIPKLTHYIQFVKSGQKIWARPFPPPFWAMPERNGFFPGRCSLTVSTLTRQPWINLTFFLVLTRHFPFHKLAVSIFCILIQIYWNSPLYLTFLPPVLAISKQLVLPIMDKLPCLVWCISF